MFKKFILFFICFLGTNFSNYEPVSAVNSKYVYVKSSIDQILQNVDATNFSVLIYNPITRDTVYKLNEQLSLVPASNTKLYSTAVALSMLGGDFELKTVLYSDDNNLSDGVVNGNLYLKGYGNSLFTSSDLYDFVQNLKNKGIRKVEGHIIGDDSYFDDVYQREDWIEEEVQNVNLPPISSLVIDRNTKAVQVKTRRKRTVTRWLPVTDPALNVAEMCHEKLEDNGILVDGIAKRGLTPENLKVVDEASIVLRELIKHINKPSDNFLAECLFKVIGAEVSGTQGSAFFSTQAIKTFLIENQIFNLGTSIVDGSGISRNDRTTTSSLTGLLEVMYFDLVNYDDYYNSLSIAGVDGTLRNRMRNTYGYNNFHGKTGTLNQVTSLSGYVKAKNGDDLIVALIYNGSESWVIKDIEDKIIDAVLSY